MKKIIIALTALLLAATTFAAGTATTRNPTDDGRLIRVNGYQTTFQYTVSANDDVRGEIMSINLTFPTSAARTISVTITSQTYVNYAYSATAETAYSYRASGGLGVYVFPGDVITISCDEAAVGQVDIFVRR